MKAPKALAGLGIVFAIVTSWGLSKEAQAAITTQGGVTPDHDGVADPWVLDGLGIVVGSGSPGELSVDGGSRVESLFGRLGDEDSSGRVTVDGAGSAWSLDTTLTVGYREEGTLEIAGGGLVEAERLRIGGAASGGAVRVEGDGSLLRSSDTIEIGGYRQLSRLTIAQGAGAITGHASLASGSQRLASVLVDGEGSYWSVDGTLTVGEVGTGELVVSNGAALTVNGNSMVSLNARSFSTPWAGRLAVLSGSQASINGSLGVGVRGGAGVVQVDSSSSLDVAGQFSITQGRPAGSELRVESGAVVKLGGLVAAASDLAGDGRIATRALVSDVDLRFASEADLTQSLSVIGREGESLTIDLDLTGSAWRGTLGAGLDAEASLEILNGVEVTTSAGMLGLRSGSHGRGRVAGAGTAWSIQESLAIGSAGDGELTVEDGGGVRVGSGLRIGLEAMGRLTIGAGSTVEVGGPTTLGQSGGDGRLAMAGGALRTHGLFAGAADVTGYGVIETQSLLSDVDLVFDSPASLRQELVLGDNVTVRLDQATTPQVVGTVAGAGYEASGSMAVRNGVVIGSESGVIAERAGSEGTVELSGAGTRWDIANNLSVGRGGRGELSVADGATLDANSMSIGLGERGAVLVDGGRIELDDTLSLSGSEGREARLEVRGGGVIETGQLQIPSQRNPGVNVAVIEGPGTRVVATKTAGGYPIRDELVTIAVAVSGTASLEVLNGASLQAPGILVGYSGSSFMQSNALVRGTGTTVSTGGTLVVADAGILTIDQGATVRSANAWVGISQADSYPVASASVAGEGSRWVVDESIQVVSSSRGLFVEDGAHVEASELVLGADQHYSQIHGANLYLSGPGSEVLIRDSVVIYPVSNRGVARNEIGITDGALLAIGGIVLQEGSPYAYETRLAIQIDHGVLAVRDAEYFESGGLDWIEVMLNGDWAPIASAVEGVDYTLERMTSGRLAGYTVLNVGGVELVPEPAAVALVAPLLLAGWGTQRSRGSWGGVDS